MANTLSNTLKRIGCLLIGWDKELLDRCSEASQRQYRKLLSALTIMMIIWGIIGYGFSSRYLNLDNTVANVAVMLCFMTIVLCVERVIILTVGKAWLMAAMRLLLALCMAVLGSAIIDQFIFRNDIQEAITERRNERVTALTELINRRHDSDIQMIMSQMDTLRTAIIANNEKIQQQPVIRSVNVTTSEQTVGLDENGNPKKVKNINTSTFNMPNPLIAQLNADNKALDDYAVRLDSIRADKKNTHEKVEKEIKEKDVGFIEELEATVQVISHSIVAKVFYFILFSFLVFLELFVLTIKMGDTKCDYDLLVERQLNLKKNIMAQTESSLTT